MSKTRSLLLALSTAACNSDPGPSVFVDEAEPGPVRSRSIGGGWEVPFDEEGVGIVVEYPGCGEWRLSAACDTELSGFVCIWDIAVLGPEDSELEVIATENFDDRDGLVRVDSGAVRLVLRTDTEPDGIRFQVPPGEPVTFDAILDGRRDTVFYYWSDGVTNNGLPLNPLELVPATPDGGAEDCSTDPAE